MASLTARRWQLVAAGAAIVVTVAAAAGGGWPFDASPEPVPARPSLWQLLLADRLTLGFVRLALVALALFTIASVPALVVGGRWLRGVGAGGLTADDAAAASETIEALESALVAAMEERDELLDLLQEAAGAGDAEVRSGRDGEPVDETDR